MKAQSIDRGRAFKNLRNGWPRGHFIGHRRGQIQNTESLCKDEAFQHFGRDIVQRDMQQTYSKQVDCPYSGWHHYFPHEVYSEHSTSVHNVQVFEKYFVRWQQLYRLDNVDGLGYVVVDFKDLSSYPAIQQSLPNIDTLLRDTPDAVLSCLGLAIHQLVTHHHRNQDATLSLELGDTVLENEEEKYTAPLIRPRIVNVGVPLPLKDMKANYYGKFVSVTGTVIRVSNIKPMCIALAFECSLCLTLQCVNQSDGKIVTPTKCKNETCRSRAFVSRCSSTQTQTIDWQKIRIQEMSDNQLDAGRIPRSVDCELTRDLVDSCIPGDVVTTAGTVKVNSANEGRGRSSDKCMFLLYVHANSVTNAKNSVDSSGVVMDIGNQHGNTTGSVAGGSGEGGRLTVEFSLRELYAVQHIHSNANLFRLIVASLCPSIYGHEMVKAGLVLALFGSDRKFANDKNRIPVRGDPHILVVGDPGLGKSQMLLAAASVAPRSVYVCGNTSTASGLTVTLSKEPGSGGDFALEAGALVLADQGCCCIDEFDKMGTQHQALLEAMEQQSISIAKAGIVCSLPARTSILAAANPSGGHYNKAKSVSENLRMGSALLSRFDLVFIMLDRPDEEMDNLLSEHVMALHAGKKKMNSTSAFMKSSSMLPDSSRVQWEADKPVCEKLKVSRGCFMDLIPHEMLRKYIGYSRMYVRPKIGSDAAKVLQRFYLELRKLHRRSDGIPITTRQLESLIRLTEARARLELREVATGQDAEEVVEIMKFSMLDVFRDQFGLLDFHRSQHGSGMSGRSKPKKFIAALQRVAEQTCNSIFTVKQMQQLVVEMGFQLVDFEDFLNSLNTHGFLLKKGPKIYELQTFGK